MKVEIKQLDIIDNQPQWNPIPAVDLLGLSVVDYMLGTGKKVIAALYQDDQPVAFVANDVSLVETYKKKGLSIHAQEIKDFLGTTLVPPMIAYTLGGSVTEINTPETVDK